MYRIDAAVDSINRCLDHEGFVSFTVVRDSGSRFASVTLTASSGGHRIEVEAEFFLTPKGRHQWRAGDPVKKGGALLFREDNGYFSAAELGFAIGQAHVRATGEPVSHEQADLGPVAVGDFVEAVTGERGVVTFIDTWHSKQVVEVQAGVDLRLFGLSQVRVLAKGR
jgi:hypothetical protein